MVGKIMSKPEARKTPGKKMATTTYLKRIWVVQCTQCQMVQ